MRVIGYRKANPFVTKDGKTVNGYFVNLGYTISDSEGFGYQPLKKSFWISETKFVKNNVEDICKKCIDIEPTYNIYGKFDSFRVL